MISANERQRANSVRSQRRAFVAGRLCGYQVRRLLCIPGLSFQPMEQAWRENLAAYALFTSSHGDAPKLRSTDATERALARWAAKARLAHRANTLSSERVRNLNGLDFWTWGAPQRRD